MSRQRHAPDHEPATGPETFDTRREFLQYIQQIEEENFRYKTREADHQKRAAIRGQIIRELETDKATMIADLARAQSKVKTMRTENEKMKERLIRMQPVNLVSDAQIGEKYDMLCEDIRDWVETEFSDVKSLLNEMDKSAKASSAHLNQMSIFLDNGLVRIMEQHENAQLSFLTCIVHRFIEYYVLREYAYGTGGDAPRVLSAVEAQMARFTPAKDAESIAMWRSETLRGLFGIPELAEHREKKLSSVTTSMGRLLGPCFTRGRDQVRAMKVFHDRVTKVAVELALLLRTQPVDYEFGTEWFPRGHTSATRMHKEDMEVFKMVDVQTERQIRKTTRLHPDAEGRIGDALCVICPALKRRGWNGQSIVISKARLLVNLNGPPNLLAQGAGVLRGLVGV